MDERHHDSCYLSVVVPCYNESRGLEELVFEILGSFPPSVRAELVLVDDGSSDHSLSVMRDLATRFPEVKYTSLSRNFGKEAAMYAGLCRSTGELVVIMDADGQHPPSVLPELVQRHLETGADQIVARRDRKGDPALRTLASRAFYRLSNRLTDVELVNGDGDFRLLTRRAVDAVLRMGEVNRFSKGLFSWIGFETEVVEYGNRNRESGQSSWSRSRLIDYGFDGILSFNSKPLRMMIHVGWIAVAFAVLYLLWLIAYTFTNGIEAPGYVTVIAAIVLFGGVQLISIGVLGEYIGRIFLETKRRPMFLIAETDEDPGLSLGRADGPRVRSVERLGHGGESTGSPNSPSSDV